MTWVYTLKLGVKKQDVAAYSPWLGLLTIARSAMSGVSEFKPTKKDEANDEAGGIKIN